MGDTMQFDLNAAVLRWRERLDRSPQFRDENLAELESHLRDAVERLQAAELSQEEAFMIAARRIGSVQQLASEFEKVNRNPMNKIIHGLVLLFFSGSCWFLWAWLTMSERLMGVLMRNEPLPAFTRFCLECRPFLYALPVLALVWCVIVWLRKTESRNSWVGFFAATASVIMLAVFPTVIAMYLPLIRAIEMATKR
jgi:hypothetical protein